MDYKVFNFRVPKSEYDQLVEKHKQEIENGKIPENTSIAWRLRDLIRDWVA